MPTWPSIRIGSAASYVDPRFARQYYESAATNHWWFQGRARLVSRALVRAGFEQGTTADLGAGAVSLFPQGFDVIKLDAIIPAGVEGAFVQASVEHLPFRDEAFAGVGLFDVLEHTDDHEGVLNEARRVVRQGGFVVVTVPAYQVLWSRHDELVGHVRRYRLADIEGLLSVADLSIAWISTFYGFLVLPALVRKLMGVTPAMTVPRPLLNRALGRLATASADRALKRRRAVGLSIAALAIRP
jgi:SAM-dependent methyltransferase